MMGAMARDQSYWARVDPLEFEQEYETWEWTRSAGVSAQDLRQAVRKALLEQPDPLLARAA